MKKRKEKIVFFFSPVFAKSSREASNHKKLSQITEKMINCQHGADYFINKLIKIFLRDEKKKSFSSPFYFVFDLY